MNYIAAHWRGRLSIAKSFWLSPLLTLVVSAPMILGSLALTNHMSFADFLQTLKIGKGFVLRTPAPLYQAIYKLLELGMLIWCELGLWRACDNPANNPKGPNRHLFIKGIIILSVLVEVQGLFAFASLIFHGEKQTFISKGTDMTKLMTAQLNIQLNQCWQLPIDVSSAHQVPVEALITMNPDRTIKEAHIKDVERLGTDQDFKKTATTVLAALNKPECHRLNLPGDAYDDWKDLDFTFDPRSVPQR